MTELFHFGAKGMHWGIRRYQNPDGSLTPEGRERYLKKMQKKDMKWIKKNEEKVYKEVYSKVKDAANAYLNNELARKYGSNARRTNGQLNQNMLNEYNRHLANLLNDNIGDVAAPSGRVVRYVAKRQGVGVYTALTDAGYDMSQVKNGVYGSGKIAYRKNRVNTANSNDY